MILQLRLRVAPLLLALLLASSPAAGASRRLCQCEAPESRLSFGVFGAGPGTLLGWLWGLAVDAENLRGKAGSGIDPFGLTEKEGSGIDPFGRPERAGSGTDPFGNPAPGSQPLAVPVAATPSTSGG